MGRWEPDARGRLERAALQLFTEQGFAATTVPQITAHAGLTPRTFFRHFADKKEVLFAFEEDFPTLVARLMRDAPASRSPMALIEDGLVGLAQTRFEPRRQELAAHRAVVQSDEGLRERELQKNASLAAAIRDGFLHRGEDELTATLAAHLAVTVLTVSISCWLDGEDARETRRPLPEIMRTTLRRLARLTSEHAP